MQFFESLCGEYCYFLLYASPSETQQFLALFCRVQREFVVLHGLEINMALRLLSVFVNLRNGATLYSRKFAARPCPSKYVKTTSNWNNFTVFLNLSLL